MIKRLVIGIALVVVVCAVVFWSYSEAIISVPVDEKVIALTYDDGPNPPHTQALLALLAQHGVKATFFVKGRNVEAFPDGVRAVLHAGHEIGNHGYFHRPMLSLSTSAMQREVQRANESIAAVTGHVPTLFRPPFGAQGPGLKQALSALRMPSILMSTHGLDWERTDPQAIAAGVLNGIEPGDIVLLHDGHGDMDDPHAQDSRAPTVAATGIIIETLKAQGYRFATVTELMALSAARRP